MHDTFNSETGAQIGAVVVAFNSADVICECLDSLLAQDGAHVRVAVVENASTDDTLAVVRNWAAERSLALAEVKAGEKPSADSQVFLVHSGANRGFAGGVNVGLAALALDPNIQHFWVLNPDAFAEKGAARAILHAAELQPAYGLMGGRVCYAEPPHRVQIDGGLINFWTGVTGNYNLGVPLAQAQLPRADQLDFITGANMVASRRFYERVGPMREDYFLYYEEADWAMRRGEMPLVVACDFTVFHHAGTSIGSPTLERLATPFSFWFKYRSRVKFIARFRPLALPVTLAYATAKACQLLLKGAFPQATTLLRAVYGLPPPKSVSGRLTPEAARYAFGKSPR